MDSLKSVIKSYEHFVKSNPETISELETTTKWVSYFIAGRISDSNVASELVYTLSNMLVLYNDRILQRTLSSNESAKGTVADKSTAGVCYRLRIMLTTLEYSEVFIEISARRLFGKKGRWILISVFQMVKAITRFFILKHSSDRIITSPAMPVLNRRELIKLKKTVSANEDKLLGGGNAATNNSIEEHSFTFELKRSGRVVRKVEGAPPLQYREFKLPKDNDHLSPKVVKVLLQAEYLYIAKPLLHLAAMGIFGEKSWKQFTLALALDLTSIRLYHKNRHLMNKQQKLEMSRRCINLLLYLMRSPFYERFTQSRLERVLGFVADNVPIVRMVAGPLRDYIPHWQATYFYLWST